MYIRKLQRFENPKMTKQKTLLKLVMDDSDIIRGFCEN